MAYPDKPAVQTSYAAVEQALGDGSLPGAELDVDFANLRDAIDETIDFLKGPIRSDGALNNGVVTVESLASDVVLGVDPPTPWATATAYAPPDTVFETNRFYICATAHTSSVFATDLASGRWTLLADFTPPDGSLLVANDLSDLNDAAVARTNLGLGSLAVLDAGTGGGDFRTNDENDARFQPLDAALTSLSGLTTVPDRLPYATDSDTYALTTLTAYARTLLDDADAATARATLGLGAVATAASITTSEIAAATLVTEAEGISSNDNDTTLPTSAAVKDYVDDTTVSATATWSDVSGSRTNDTIYTNSGARPLFVTIVATAGSPRSVQVRNTSGSGWLTVGTVSAAVQSNVQFFVPPGGAYQVVGAIVVTSWMEFGG